MAPIKAVATLKTSTEAKTKAAVKKTFFITAPFALLMASNVFAAPPVAYDGWTVTAGVIDTTTSCSGIGVSCTELAPAEGGFKYEKVTADGSSFFRLILTEADATGDPLLTSGVGALTFTNESYIPFALVGEGIAQGVATKQVARDAASGFDSVSEIQKGNMRSLYANTAEDMYSTKLAQSLTSGTDFNSAFDFTNYTAFSTDPQSNNPDTNTEIGRRLNISQSLLVGIAGDTSKKQVFAQSQVKGYAGNTTSAYIWPGSPPGLNPKFLVNNSAYFVRSALTTAGSLTLPVTANGKRVEPAATATVSWADAQDITTTWVAQSNNNPLSSSTAGLNFQRITNNTTAVEAVSLEVDLLEIIPPATIDPYAWDTANFGTAPSL